MRESNFDYKYWLPIISSGVVSVFALFYAHYRTKKIEDTKTQNQKQLHKYKEQFNKEYIIYTEIWAKTVGIKENYNNLFNVDNKPVFEANVKVLKMAVSNYKISIQQHRPFYDSFVFDEMNVLIRFLDAELNKLEFNTPRGIRIVEYEDYWKTSIKQKKQFEKNYENICDAINMAIQYDAI